MFFHPGLYGLTECPYRQMLKQRYEDLMKEPRKNKKKCRKLYKFIDTFLKQLANSYEKPLLCGFRLSYNSLKRFGMIYSQIG